MLFVGLHLIPLGLVSADVALPCHVFHLLLDVLVLRALLSDSACDTFHFSLKLLELVLARH